jgi:hypothetical protein
MDDNIYYYTDDFLGNVLDTSLNNSDRIKPIFYIDMQDVYNRVDTFKNKNDDIIHKNYIYILKRYVFIICLLVIVFLLIIY